MKYLLKGFIGFLVLASTYTLHLTSVENQQYDALLQQQLSFQDKMNSIKLNMTRIRNDLEDKSIDEKVDILESAIKTERQSIYEASKLLVKDQSQISDHCQILSDEEKGKIESQINNIEEEIGSLK